MMGKYFDWQPWVKRSRKKKTPEQLRRYLYKNGFIYTVNIADMYAIGDSIIYHPEITDLTSDEWTGYFLSHGEYIVQTKTEEDAMAVKLVWG